MKDWAYLELEAAPDMTRKYEIEYRNEESSNEWVLFDGNILTALGGLYHDNADYRYREKQTYDTAFEEALKRANAYTKHAEKIVDFDNLLSEIVKIGFNAGYMFAGSEK